MRNDTRVLYPSSFTTFSLLPSFSFFLAFDGLRGAKRAKYVDATQRMNLVAGNRWRIARNTGNSTAPLIIRRRAVIRNFRYGDVPARENSGDSLIKFCGDREIRRQYRETFIRITAITSTNMRRLLLKKKTVKKRGK